MSAALEPVNLDAIAQEMLDGIDAARHARDARTLYHGAQLRQTALALGSGAELPEHESPPEATLQVLRGALRLRGKGREWILRTGDVIPIPPERHSVQALEDVVFLLTVRT